MEDSETKMRRRSQTTAVCPKGVPNKRPSFYANERFFSTNGSMASLSPSGCYRRSAALRLSLRNRRRVRRFRAPGATRSALCSLPLPSGGRCQRDRSRSDGIRLDLAGRQKTLIGESAPANMAMLVKNTAAQGLAVPSLKAWQAPEGSDGQRGCSTALPPAPSLLERFGQRSRFLCIDSCFFLPDWINSPVG